MNLKKHYNKESKKWFKDICREPEKYYTSWINLSGFSGKTAVDLGCGAGTYSLELAKHFNRVYAIDFAENMLRELKANAKLKGIENIVPVHSDTRITHLSDSSVDFVFSSGLMECLEQPRIQLQEIRRILKPGGLACLRWLNRKGVWGRLEIIRNTMGSPSGIQNPGLYTVREIIQLCKSANLQIKEIHKGIKYPLFLLPAAGMLEILIIKTKLVYALEKINGGYYSVCTILRK